MKTKYSGMRTTISETASSTFSAKLELAMISYGDFYFYSFLSG